MQKAPCIEMILCNEASIFIFFYLLTWFCCPGGDVQRNNLWVKNIKIYIFYTEHCTVFCINYDNLFFAKVK